MVTKTKQAMRCGFCGNGNHDRCPGGVRNGDGSIVTCACSCELAAVPRCMDCWHRNPDDIGPDWTCIEKDGCASRLTKRQKGNPTLVMMRKIRTEVERKRDLEVKIERKATKKVEKYTECRCCGKKTKGGKFLPGHDSTYLSRLVELGDEDSRQIAYSISPAFGNKFDKRVKNNA